METRSGGNGRYFLKHLFTASSGRSTMNRANRRCLCRTCCAGEPSRMAREARASVRLDGETENDQ